MHFMSCCDNLLPLGMYMTTVSNHKVNTKRMTTIKTCFIPIKMSTPSVISKSGLVLSGRVEGGRYTTTVNLYPSEGQLYGQTAHKFGFCVI